LIAPKFQLGSQFILFTLLEICSLYYNPLSFCFLFLDDISINIFFFQVTSKQYSIAAEKDHYKFTALENFLVRYGTNLFSCHTFYIYACLHCVSIGCFFTLCKIIYSFGINIRCYQTWLTLMKLKRSTMTSVVLFDWLLEIPRQRYFTYINSVWTFGLLRSLHNFWWFSGGTDSWTWECQASDEASWWEWEVLFWGISDHVRISWLNTLLMFFFIYFCHLFCSLIFFSLYSIRIFYFLFYLFILNKGHSPVLNLGPPISQPNPPLSQVLVTDHNF